jgi:hypothetical protein
VAVIAAHAVATKATAHAHTAHAAQNAAVPPEEAALFANLLAEIGGTEEGSQKTGKDVTDPEKILDAHLAAKKSKTAKGDATDDASAIVDAQALQAQLAVLNATSTDSGRKQGKAEDGGDPVKAADAAKDAGDTSKILDRMLDAGTKAASGKGEPPEIIKKTPDGTDTAADAKEASSKDAASMAAGAAAVKATGAKQSDPAPSAKETQVADTVKLAQAAAGDAAETKAAAAAKDAKTAKKDDAKDASSQNQTPDKADALSAAADKTMRQNAASQGQQGRALPVHIAAQMTASQSGSDNKSGNDSGSAHTQSQHAKAEAGTQERKDAVQPASPAPLNTAGPTQTVTQTHTGTGNVQPAVAQVQPQTAAPVVAASLQVAPQTAQMAAQPDIAALAVQIAAKSDEGTKHFDIRIDPPELGRVEVKLTIDDAGHAQAHLSVEKPQTLDLLQNDRNNLERALRDSGIALSQNGLNFSLKGQDRQGENPAPFRGRSRNLAVTAAIESTSAAAAASTNSFAAGNARLDIRV